jgi:hypothetical protein
MMGTVNLYDMFETKKDLEKDGFWYKFSEDTQFLLARAGGSNVAFAKKLEATTRPYKRQIESGNMDEEFGAELTIKAFYGTVLKGWKGVMDEAGLDEIEFTEENAVTLLKALPDLFVELKQQAMNLSNYQDKQNEEDAGNS